MKGPDAEARLLLETQELIPAGSWEYDLETGEVTWTESLHRLFGVDSESFRPDYQSYLEHVRSDYRDQVREHVHRASVHGEDFEHEYVAIRGDGVERTFRARGRAVLDEKGKPSRLVGTCVDVTAQRSAELAAMRRTEEARALVKLGERALEGASEEGMLDEATEAAVSTDGVATAWIIRLGEGRAEILTGRGLPPGIAVGRSLADAPLSEAAVEEGGAASVDDWRALGEMPHAELSREEIRSSIAVPIYVRGSDWLCLEAHSPQVGRFRELDAGFFVELAQITSRSSAGPPPAAGGART